MTKDEKPAPRILRKGIEEKTVDFPKNENGGWIKTCYQISNMG
jgi:hypothetical protein